MKIEKGTIYHLPTKESETAFLKLAEEQGVTWSSGRKAAKLTPFWGHSEQGQHAIWVSKYGGMQYSPLPFYKEHWVIYGTKIVKFDPLKQKPEVRIIKLNGLKIVYNPPYTIVTDGTFKGKAKCNPTDEYDPVEGLRIAAERLEKAKKPEEVEFKVGDRVKVTGGLYHWFKPGDIGIIVGINSDIDAEVKVGCVVQSIDFGDLELCTE